MRERDGQTDRPTDRQREMDAGFRRKLLDSSSRRPCTQLTGEKELVAGCTTGWKSRPWEKRQLNVKEGEERERFSLYRWKKDYREKDEAKILKDLRYVQEECSKILSE